MRPLLLTFSLCLALLLSWVGASVSLEGSAAAKKSKRVVLIESTAWELTGPLKGSLKKVGKIKGSLRIQLFFGPLDLVDDEGQVVVALETGHFLIQDLDSGAILQGQFIDNGKGKLVLSPELDELRSVLASTFEAAFDVQTLEIIELSLDKVTMNAKAKAKGEEDTMKLKLSTKFTAGGTLNNVPGQSKGTLSFSVVGSPVAVGSPP